MRRAISAANAPIQDPQLVPQDNDVNFNEQEMDVGINDPELNEHQPLVAEPELNEDQDHLAEPELNDDQDHLAEPANIPLNHPLSTYDVYMKLLLHQIRHNTTNISVVDNAKMYNSNLDQAGNKLKTSYEAIKSECGLFNPVIYKFFYVNCPHKITKPVENLDEATSCRHDCIASRIIPKQVIAKADSGKSTFFNYVHLETWLKYAIPMFHSFFSNNQRNDQSLHDLRDGSEYQRLAELHEESTPDQTVRMLTISLGYDGVVYSGKFTNNTMWPLVAYVNDLPFNLRQKFSFLIALHASKDKPDDESFIPVVQEFNKFFHTPIEVEIAGQLRKFKIYLLNVIGDAPVRASLLKINSYSGYNSCMKCHVPGVMLPNSSRNVNGNFSKTMRFQLGAEFTLRTKTEWLTV